MRLTAPTPVTFWIATIVAIAALVSRYAGVSIPVISGNEFVTLLVGFVILFIGNVIRGL